MASEGLPFTRGHYMPITQGLRRELHCSGLSRMKKVGQDFEFLVDGDGLTLRREHNVPFDPKQFPRKT